MKKEYDLLTMKSRPSPYAKELENEATITADKNVIEYFKKMAKKHNTSYQKLISSYLEECMITHRELSYH